MEYYMGAPTNYVENLNGYPMSKNSSQSSASDSIHSQNTQITEFSSYSVAPSQLTMSHSSTANYIHDPGPYGSIPSAINQASSCHHQSQSVRHTPHSLGWNIEHAMWTYYDLELPPKESRNKDPLLVLKEGFPPSDYAPSGVYLDKELNPRKGYHPCQYPGQACWKKGTRPSFSRSADLIRHYKHLHISAENREDIPCDYSNCERFKNPFGRKDHLRDHLRDFHKEDMPRPKDDNKENWKEERRISKSWWRCSKCLSRRYISKYGFKCPSCKQDCEDERIAARQSAPAPAPACTVCEDKGYYDGGSGEWISCTYCPPQPSSQMYENPYTVYTEYESGP